MDFKIEATERKNYASRMLSALSSIFIITLFIVLVALFSLSTSGQLQVSFIICCPILLVMFLYSGDQVSTYFITEFEVKDEQLHVLYTKRNTQFELNGALSEYTFKVGKAGFINNRVSYLQITLENGDIVLRQYQKWGWGAGKFDELLIGLKGNEVLT